MQQKNKAVFHFWLISHVKNNLFKKRSKSARQTYFSKSRQRRETTICRAAALHPLWYVIYDESDATDRFIDTIDRLNIQS